MSGGTTPRAANNSGERGRSSASVLLPNRRAVKVNVLYVTAIAAILLLWGYVPRLLLGELGSYMAAGALFASWGAMYLRHVRRVTERNREAEAVGVSSC